MNAEDERAARLKAEEDASTLREQLSTLQDKWMELEEWSESAKRELKQLRGEGTSSEGTSDASEDADDGGEGASTRSLAGEGATVASIETLYREQNHALRRDLKKLKRSMKEMKVQHDAQLKRALKKIETHKAKAKTAEEEAERLRERACDLQLELEGKKAANASAPVVAVTAVDTFDTEGQFQMLYKETLNALNQVLREDFLFWF
jgi:DNA repair exonuclease SbcCD ATPase subunit